MASWRHNLPWNKDRKGDAYETPPATEFEDCFSCRVVGSTALVSLGGYTYFSGMQQLRLQKEAIMLSKSKYKYGSRQLGIICLSATLFGMGMYRMVN